MIKKYKQKKADEIEGIVYDETIDCIYEIMTYLNDIDDVLAVNYKKNKDQLIIEFRDENDYEYVHTLEKGELISIYDEYYIKIYSKDFLDNWEEII